MGNGRQTHTVRQFDNELRHMSQQILEFGALVTRQLEDAATAILNRDADLASAVLKREGMVNQLDAKIEDMALRLVATRCPKGRDLRAVFGMLKSGTDLERIGDEAKKVAKFAKLRAMSDSGVPEELAAPMRAMSGEAREMLTALWAAIDAGDVDGAVRAAERDRVLDRAYSASLNEVHRLMADRPEQIRNLSECLLTLKAIERIGDHAKNIARYFVFYARGENVSHVKAKHLRKAVGLAPEDDSGPEDGK